MFQVSPWPRLIIAAAFGAFLLSQAQAAPGDLYVAGEGRIYKFTPAGERSTFASGLFQPVAVAFDRSGNLFVGNSGEIGCVPEIQCPPPPSTIVKITPDGTQSTFATISSPNLLALAFDAAGNLFVSIGNSILKIAPDGTQTTFASQMHGAWPLAFDNFGNLYVGVNPIGPPSIVKFAPDGSSTTFVTLTGSSSSIIGLAFGLGADLYVRVSSSILKVRPDGSRATFATNDRLSYALAFDASGVLVAALNAYNSAEPAIVRFTSSGSGATFAFGPLLTHAFAFEPVREKVRNISARGLVSSGENTLIGGFIVGGSALANNAVIARAIGPSLSKTGVSNPLSDPVLELRDSSGALVASNNDWQDTQKTQISASGLAPTDPRESAIFATLPTGSYTAVVLSGDHSTGIAVVEVYSVTQ